MRKLLLILCFVLPGLSAAEPLRVFASVLPIQSFVQQIGGEYVDARAMVRPGFNPHTYDPTPRQISALAEAALYVRTGVPFENAWMARIRAANPYMQVMDARDGMNLLQMAAHSDAEEVEGGHQHAHDHGDEQDPHVWTSPRLALRLAANIRDKLSELMPEHTVSFAANYDAFAAELQALDQELHGLLDPLPQRRFLVYHPAWGYFANAYGLTQVPIEREGKGPGARALAALIEQARQEGIKLVFVQPQFDQRRAAQVARAIDGGVIAVDPLAADYVANMRRVGREFAKALQR